MYIFYYYLVICYAINTNIEEEFCIYTDNSKLMVTHSYFDFVEFRIDQIYRFQCNPLGLTSAG